MSTSGIIKGIALFLSGAGLGALGSALYFERKAEKRCEEYEQKCYEEYRKAREEIREKELKQEYESASTKNSSSDISVKKSEPTDYTRYAKHPEDTKDIIRRAEEKMVEEAYPMEDDTNRPKKLRGPRLIKNEDYGNDRTLERLELFYYTDDETLTNDEDEIIEPEIAEKLIGDALYKYGFASNNELEICVRNEKHGCDYKIQKIKASYAG